MKEPASPESIKFNKILKAIRKNSHDGVKKFYENYGQIIKSTAIGFSKSNEIADEVVNEVLYKVWQFAYTKKKIKNHYAWLYVITINCIKDIFKGFKNHECLDENIPAQIDEIQQLVDEEYFYYILRKLSQPEKEIVISRIKWRLSFQDIAEITNQPLSTVSACYYRAIEKLK